MRHVNGVDLKQWFSDSVTASIGFSPATTTPKPVHVLNGLLQRSLNGPRAPRTMVDLTATRGGVWASSAADARTRAARSDPPITLPSDDEDFDEMRRLVRGLLASDGAVHPSKHSFQIGHPAAVTVDIADAKMGDLAAQLLLGPGDGGEALLALVERLCERQPNPVWAVTSALTADLAAGDWTLKQPEQAPWIAAGACTELATNLGRLLRACCRLAAESVDSLDGLKILAAAATWSCVISLSQVPSLELDGRLLPLLAVFGDGLGAPTVRDTSSVDSVSRVEAAYDRWVAHLFTHRIEADFAGGPTEEEVGPYLEAMKPYKINPRTQLPPVDAQRVLRQVPHMFAAHLGSNAEESGDSSAETIAAAQTLADVLRATMTTSGPEWLASAGRSCGFVGPRRGKKAARRFCIEVPLTPVLVLAGMNEDEESLDMDVWLERLGDRFGILIGPSDAAQGLRPRPADEDLRANRRMLGQALEVVGLARSYSDNTTEVLNPLHLWAHRSTA